MFFLKLLCHIMCGQFGSICRFSAGTASFPIFSGGTDSRKLPIRGLLMSHPSLLTLSVEVPGSYVSK